MPSHKKEMDWKLPWTVAERIKGELVFKGIKSKICGSLRRRCKMVHDVDMVVQTNALHTSTEIDDVCEKFGMEMELLTTIKPDTKNIDLLIHGMPPEFTGQLPDPIQFNVMVTTEEAWGAAIMHLTGSMKFNTMMRGRAKKMGYKLNQYGLFHGDEQIAGRTEGQIFRALLVEPLSPSQRSTAVCYLKFEETTAGKPISAVKTMTDSDLNASRLLYCTFGCKGCFWVGELGKCSIQKPNIMYPEDADRAICLSRKEV